MSTQGSVNNTQKRQQVEWNPNMRREKPEKMRHLDDSMRHYQGRKSSHISGRKRTLKTTPSSILRKFDFLALHKRVDCGCYSWRGGIQKKKRNDSKKP
ncbi:hypothetical protein TNCV_1489621 [Trichonephila clavipes]|nr:hypothetical protein TNCV_1489621 [Trichonephila clavipes]